METRSVRIAFAVGVWGLAMLAACGGEDGPKTSTPTAAPSPPTSVNAVAGDAQVTMTWAAVSNATTYTVFYGTLAGVTKSSITRETSIASTSKTISGLLNGTTYYFRVMAVNVVGESSLSSETSATPAKALVPRTWSAGPSFGANGAYNHSATAFEDGKKVLIVGGTSATVSGSTLNEATEAKYFVYDASGRTMSSAQLVQAPINGTPTYFSREKHTATLLNNGRVLLIGGVARSLSSANGLTNDDDAIRGHALLYDPTLGWQQAGAATGTARPTTAAFNNERFGHVAVSTPANQVILIGGFGEDAGSLGSNESTGITEFYDSPTDTTRFPSPSLALQEDRWHHTATRLDNGRILIAGGVRDPGYSSSSGAGPNDKIIPKKSAELLTLGTSGGTSTAGSLFVARFGHTAIKLGNGKVLVAGGFGVTGAALISTEIYNPSTGQWSTGPSLNAARGDHVAIFLPSTGEVLVAGGSTVHDLAAGDNISLYNTAAILDSAEIYDPVGNTWTLANTMTAPRWRATAVTLFDGSVLVIGGWNGSKSLNSTELFKP